MKDSVETQLKGTVGRSRSGRANLGGYLLFVFVIAGLSALLVWGVAPEVLDGQLIESDNYMRLVRVTHLVESRGWYDNSIPRSNAPYGEVLHWTRPLDVIILGATAPMLAFLPFDKALHLAAVVLPPLFLLLICIAVAWATMPLAGERFRFYAMITVLAQLGVVGYSLPGRVDHHPLLLLLFALSLGLAIRWILTPQWPRLALCTGAVLGLGLWVSPEFLVPLMLIVVTGTLVWIVEGGHWARKNLRLAIWLLAAVIMAWLLEHPPAGLSAEEYDRISAPHVLVSALVLTFWAIIVSIEGTKESEAVPRRGVRRRSSLAVLGAGAGLAALFLTYPSFFQGPTADLDPRIWLLWRDLIEEGQAWVPPSSLVDLGNLVAHLGAAVFCVPFVGWALASTRWTPHWWAWVFLGFALAAYTSLGLYMIRHVPYAEVLLVMVTVTMLSRILPKLESMRNRHVRTLGRAGVAAALITGPLFLGLTLTALGGETGMEAREASRLAADHCPIPSLVSFLSSHNLVGERPKTVVAHVDYGPKILYRTPHRVLGTLYHRNAEGILAVFAILRGTDMGQIRELIQDREVDLILVCPLHSWLYGSEMAGDATPPSLHDLLLSDRGPDWLESVSVPADVAGGFRLFRVTRGHERPGGHSESSSQTVSGDGSARLSLSGVRRVAFPLTYLSNEVQ